jgi:hypothetical protein
MCIIAFHFLVYWCRFQKNLSIWHSSYKAFRVALWPAPIRSSSICALLFNLYVRSIFWRFQLPPNVWAMHTRIISRTRLWSALIYIGLSGRSPGSKNRARFFTGRRYRVKYGIRHDTPLLATSLPVTASRYSMALYARMGLIYQGEPTQKTGWIELN